MIPRSHQAAYVREGQRRIAELARGQDGEAFANVEQRVATEIGRDPVLMERFRNGELATIDEAWERLFAAAFRESASAP